MKIKIAFLSLVVSVALLTALMLPTSALADDDIPPTPAPVQIDDTGTTDPIVNAEAAADGSQTAGSSDVAAPDISEPAAVVESVADVVQLLNEADAVLVDENQNPIPLSTQAAAEILASSDPYFFDGTNWIGYSASGVCPPIVTAANCNTNSTPFQAAINAASAGTTLHVEAGTYAEQLTINKSLVIQGSGANNTFIQAPSVLAAGANGERSIVTITGAGISVDFSGFTVEGPGPGGCNSINYGIFVRNGANADIHDNVVDGIRDNPLGGCQNGNAIGVGRKAYGTTGTATIEDNTITDFQKTGIIVDNSGSDATITGNTITGAGPTSIIAQNGIQISRGATADVTDNTISAFDYLIPSGGYPWTSAGVLLYQPGATVVDNNTVTDSNVGIYDYQSSNAVISDNTISGSCSDMVGGAACDQGGWGVYSYQSTNLTMTDNTITDNTIGAGFYNSTATIRYNLFDGNDTGFLNDGTSTVDATLNCWGSSTGPTHASNPGGTGDAVGNNILFDPWECPTTPAPTGTANSGSKPPSKTSNIIPVTGGQHVEISCEVESMTVQLGDLRVTFTGLCGYTVILNQVQQDGLPGGVGAGNDFSTGLSITLMKNGAVVEVLPTHAEIQVSYPMPANKDASILSWNGNAWDELATSEVDARLVASLTIPNTFAVMITQ